MKITNLESHASPDTLLGEEIDVVLAILKNVMNGFIHDSISGTFMLGGIKESDQESDRLFREIIALDFEEGPTENFDFEEKDSRAYAREVLALDANAIHELSIASISYYYDTPIRLSAKTTYGRFNCAVFSDSIDSSLMAFIYCAIIQTLACMRKEDVMLQKSCKHIFKCEKERSVYNVIKLKDDIITMFMDGSLPEIATWKKWHEKSLGNLNLFFE